MNLNNYYSFKKQLGLLGNQETLTFKTEFIKTFWPDPLAGSIDFCAKERKYEVWEDILQDEIIFTKF